MKNYLNLEQQFEKIEKIRDIQELLHWDDAVLNPVEASSMRTDQLIFLEEEIYRKITNPEIENLIEKAKSEDLDKWQKSNLREIEHQYFQSVALDEKLVSQLTKAASECDNIWRISRKDNDFETISPYFDRLLQLTKEKASILGEKHNCSDYDALLSEFDPGNNQSKIDAIFSDIEDFLPNFTDTVIEKQKSISNKIKQDSFPQIKQEKLCKIILEKIGFNFNAGRLDISDHPFSSGSHNNIRLTTRYDEKDFTSSLFAALHEMGHGFFEHHLPKKWQFQPVGHVKSFALHESQSLFYENQICRSKEFISFLEPFIKETFGDYISSDQLYNSITSVKADFIRVDADEVTYPSHILIRYQIEKDLISGKIMTKDIPEIWNELYKKNLNIIPPNNSLGCLQDTHWYSGCFGYFPCYLVGAITAAQIYRKMSETVDISNKVKDGTFHPITDWLKENIHQYGSYHENNDDLLVKLTGSPLEAESYKTHLRERYL